MSETQKKKFSFFQFVKIVICYPLLNLMNKSWKVHSLILKMEFLLNEVPSPKTNLGLKLKSVILFGYGTSRDCKHIAIRCRSDVITELHHGDGSKLYT